MDRFYTPGIVAQLMIDLISPTLTPNTAIDICSGSWNLLKAARDRWTNIRLIGVDIDGDSKNHAVENAYFYCVDGRQFALNNLTKNRKYSLVLANPPFSEEKIIDQKAFKQLPGFSEMKPHALRRLETTMVLANLAILADAGSMAIVVPNTLINGESFSSLRAYIGNNYSVTRIVHLPTIVFGRDICTSLVYLQATGRTVKNLRIYEAFIDMVKQKYKTKYRYSIDAKHVRSGIWNNTCSIPANQAVDYEIKRGQISNSDLSTSGNIPVLHSTDIPILGSNWEPTRYVYNEGKIPQYNPYAYPGDIVITRVGRNSGLFNIYKGNDPVPVSDCIILIKDGSLSVSILEILKSSKYIKDLDFLRHGLNVKYITINTLRNYININLATKGGCTNDNTKTGSSCTG